MRLSVLMAILVLALIPTAAAVAGPVIQIEETSVDVGQALQGQKVEGVFQVSNPGDAVLEIKKVAPG